MLIFLMFFKDFASPLRYSARNSGQFCDFNSIASVGRTGLNRFRVIDTDTDLASNEVTITIG